MKLSMPFKEYLGILKGYSNLPLTLNRITLPFGIISDSQESDGILLGHVLDDLAGRINPDQPVDPIDVLTSAYELGHDQAGTFLDEIPYMVYRMSKELGVAGNH